MQEEEQHMSHCFKTAEIFRVADQWTIKTSILIISQASVFSKAYVSDTSDYEAFA